MIFISKNLNKKEIELVYDLFLRCQAGDKSVLNDLFKMQNKQISRIDELIEERRIKSLDNVLNPEMDKLIREYDNEDRNVDFKNENVIFGFDILNKMLSKIKREYSKSSMETGYENGVKKKHQNCKKYYPGEYDITELPEIMYEVIIAIFQAELDGNGCVTLNGKKNKLPIIDGVSLLKNISYFCSIQANEEQSKRYKDISGTVDDREDGAQSESLNLFDRQTLIEWEREEADRWSNQGEILRLLVYADVLEWLREHKDSIYSLFKKDSYEIQAIINTILSNEKVFINENDGCLQFVKHKELQQLIYEQTGKTITLTNISTNIKLIEQRLIDYLLYSLNYRIGHINKEQIDNKTQRIYADCELQELDKKRYFKLFGRESMFIYKICSLCSNGGNTKYFLKHIREHDDAVIPVLSLVKGRKKYDMINLIHGDLDVINNDISHEQIINDIVHTLLCNYKDAEVAKISELKKQYKITDRFSGGKSQMWETELQGNYLKINYWSSENIKRPVSYKIIRDNLLVYEGYDNFYLCDESEMLCYLMPKGKRVITKSDSRHNIFFEKIA